MNSSLTQVLTTLITIKVDGYRNLNYLQTDFGDLADGIITHYTQVSPHILGKTFDEQVDKPHAIISGGYLRKRLNQHVNLKRYCWTPHHQMFTKRSYGLWWKEDVIVHYLWIYCKHSAYPPKLKLDYFSSMATRILSMDDILWKINLACTQRSNSSDAALFS